MKKIIISITIAIGMLSHSFSQDVYPCHTSVKQQEFIETLLPDEKLQYQIEKENYNQSILDYISNHPELLNSSSSHTRYITYTIPVVFHIIHQNGPENISNEQIYNALQHLNDDFQKLNEGWPNVVSDFLPLVADVGIEFKLAKIDPFGNCTNGITRTYSASTATGNGTQQVNAVKDEHGNWAGDKYLNFFIAKNLGGAAGYTMTPSTWVGSSMSNGIFVLHNYTGSIGSVDYRGTHTLTHEVGHWLNLDHTWGPNNESGLEENCMEDDGVDDTPLTKGWTTCNLNGSTCDGTLDNVENYMEYSYCSKMFTLGQKARMHAALNNSTGGRNRVWRSANLATTGVNLPGILCEVEFQSNMNEVCMGVTIQFKDFSYENVTSWLWEFEGGVPATSTEETPSVVYNNQGEYNVKLTVSDGTHSLSKTKDAYIKVLNHGVPIPFLESFENESTITDSSMWSVENPGDNAQFEITNTASFTGNQSIKLGNYDQTAGNIDAIVSQPIDLSSITSQTGVTLSFRYAYRKRFTTNDEWLRVHISNTCGRTWVQRKTIKYNQLGDERVSNTWTPSSSEDWITTHMTNITSTYWVDDFRVKFEFESDRGNNLYIDDINIYSGAPKDEIVTDISENELSYNFSVFPNPAESQANVVFNLKNNQNVKVSLINTLGQILQNNFIKANKGENIVILNVGDIQSGIYFIQLDINGVQKTQRLIVQ